jgi:hypothetical protein
MFDLKKSQRLGWVLKTLGLPPRTIHDVFGAAVEGTRYASTRMSGLQGGLDDCIRELSQLSEQQLLHDVADDPRSSHRMARVSEIESRWPTYEAFVSNWPPLQFRDDQESRDVADALVEDAEDRTTYVEFLRRYGQVHTSWLTQDPSRRRHDVVLCEGGLVDNLRSFKDPKRAEDLIERMKHTVQAYQSTFALLVLDTFGRMRLNELQVLSRTPLSLFSLDPPPTESRCTIAIEHLRMDPDKPHTDYAISVISNPPFVGRLFNAIRASWFLAIGQYYTRDKSIPLKKYTPATAAHTMHRLDHCLESAYP